MKMKRTKTPEKRGYRQGARAEAAQASADRIIEVFRRAVEAVRFDEIRLEDIADEAGVSVQTVIRRFGGKEGLLDAAGQRMADEIHLQRAVRQGDVAAAVRAVTEDYERTGDLIMHFLAQEDRYPAIRKVSDVGRSYHRAWTAGVFAEALDPLPAAQKRALLDRLVVALDLYVWKLVRRDMQRPVSELRKIMTDMVEAALAAAKKDISEKEAIS